MNNWMKLSIKPKQKPTREQLSGSQVKKLEKWLSAKPKQTINKTAISRVPTKCLKQRPSYLWKKTMQNQNSNHLFSQETCRNWINTSWKGLYCSKRKRETEISTTKKALFVHLQCILYNPLSFVSKHKVIRINPVHKFF